MANDAPQMQAHNELPVSQLVRQLYEHVAVLTQTVNAQGDALRKVAAGQGVDITTDEERARAAQAEYEKNQKRQQLLAQLQELGFDPSTLQPQAQNPMYSGVYNAPQAQQAPAALMQRAAPRFDPYTGQPLNTGGYNPPSMQSPNPSLRFTTD